uniref:Prokineticin 1 n=1 Tax=Calidris pygmaea TaxID=425635 RepID=A0A8C3KVB7_9CHAR
YKHTLVTEKDIIPSHPPFILTNKCSPGSACERDPQCGSGTCCAVSLWLRGLRMCTPLGQEGDECHPFSHKVPGWGLLGGTGMEGGGQGQGKGHRAPRVPFFGKRQHHTCPCLPNFICSRFLDGRYRCSLDFKNIDF